MPIQDTPTIKEVLGDNEFELPIGFTDGDGTLHKTVTLQEMTGYVDEAMSDQKVRSNPGKMLTELIHGVVEKMGSMKTFSKDNARNLSNADRDFILAMNYKVSLGEEVTWEDACGNCGEKFEATIAIDALKVKYMTQDEPKLMKITLPNGIKDGEGNVYKELTVSAPNGLVQERIVPLINQNPNHAATQLMVLITEEIKGLEHWNFETFQKMTKKDRRHIQKEISKVDVGIDLTPMVNCASCGHNYNSQIPIQSLLGE